MKCKLKFRKKGVDILPRRGEEISKGKKETYKGKEERKNIKKLKI